MDHAYTRTVVGPDSFSLDGKNILITGASSGLGRACAVTASRLGANVVLVGRNEDRLKAVHAELDGRGCHMWLAQDLTAHTEIDPLVQGVVSRLGMIDGLVHSAGAGATLPLRSTTRRQLEPLFAVNVYAAIELCRVLSKKTVAPVRGASYVLISSVMGALGEAGKVGYCASKSALLAAAKAIALELAPRRIRVNCVLPGVVETEMAAEYFASVSSEARAAVERAHPLGLGRPGDVANACAFLLSDASSWMTGTNVMVDGGYSAK